MLLIVALGIYLVRFKSAPVTTHPVALGEVREEVLGTGTLEARVKTTISPRVLERIAEVLVDQGDRVEAGQLLVRLDDAESRRQVAIAEAGLASALATVERVRADEARAQAVLQQARLNHKRVEGLAASRTVAQSDLDGAIESLRVAEADLSRSQAAIAEAQGQGVTAEKNLLYRREQMDFTSIRSPYGGLVTRRDRDAGEIVVPGAALLQLVSTNEIWISAWVDESAMAGLRPGLPARVVFRAQPERTYAGEVARLGREADPETREFVVDVRLDGLPPHWMTGMRAEVFIETGRRTGVPALPPRFLLWRGGRPGVFVEEKGLAAWRDLTLGLRGREAVEVLRGLSPGDRVLAPAGPEPSPLVPGRRVRPT